MFCPNCGNQAPEGANNCPNCGASLKGEQQTQNYQSNPDNNVGEPKSKLVAGLLGILLGCLGVHDFYLGNNRNGIIKLLLTLIGGWLCGIGAIAAGIWGLIEGIMILTGNIKADANGVPLKE